MYKGIKELLNNLYSEGYLLVINTNAYEQNCLPLLENVGIKLFFDFIVTAEKSKDKVYKLKLILEKYGQNKNNYLFVTDTLGDVRDATIAEMPTVAVTWGVHDKSFFNREKNPYLISIVNTITELSDFIKKY